MNSLLVIFGALSPIFVHCNIYNNTELFESVEELVDGFDTFQTPINNNEYFPNGTTTTGALIDIGTYDFIIVGGGTAGGVLANRLTEVNFNVLLIEAGGQTPDSAAVLGVAPYFMRGPCNWGYNTTSQNMSCLASIDQQCPLPRGKCLGGSSTINGGYYVRGNREDFNKWEQLGNVGWAYDDVLPYFKKSEFANFSSYIDPDYHGFDGLQSIGVPEDVPGLTVAIESSLLEIGLPELDYNGENQLGFSRLQIYTAYNIRSETNFSFIKPAIKRPNLNIILEALATKLIIENNVATGVEFAQNGRRYIVKASKEVLVSCGTYNTPQLLMLSGIGPKEELNKHEIEVVANLPVGKYLVDHVMFLLLNFKTNYTYYNDSLETLFELWTENKRPLTTGYGSQVVSFFDLDDDEIPDIEIFTLTSSPLVGSVFTRAESVYAEVFEDYNQYTDFLMPVMLLHPASNGQITLASTDPKDYPLINTNYLSEDSDIDQLYQGFQIVLALNNTEALQNFSATLKLVEIPGCDDLYESASKDWFNCSIRHFTTTPFHAVGTARMGTSPEDSVVDTNLKVYGVEKLRIVDASVMPTHVSGHPAAATVMIAEKIADLIKTEYC